MTKNILEPVYHHDSEELIGYIVDKGNSFEVLTFFEYKIGLAASHQDAERMLRGSGLSYLMGVWQYYDKEEQDWFPCVIKEAFPQKVIVNRTNSFGYSDPDVFKQVIIEHPSEENLIKSS